MKQKRKSLQSVHCSVVTIALIVLVSISGLIRDTEGVALPWSGTPAPLYGPEDQVYLVNATNIKDHIYSSQHAWVLEFFSSWCGHCIHFAPKWKQFALDLAPWQNKLVIAGIDCADENNIDMCRQYEVMGYPSIRFFPPNSPPTKEVKKDGVAKEDLNRGEDVDKSENLSDMKRSILDFMIKYLPNYHSQNITTSSLHDSKQVWDFVKSKVPAGQELPSLIVIAFESNEKSYSTAEVAMHLSKFNSVVIVRVYQKTPLYTHMGLEGWPATGYLKSDHQTGEIKLEKNQNIPRFLAKTIAELAGAPVDQITADSDIHKIIVEKKGTGVIETASEDNQKQEGGQSNNLEEPNVNANVVSMEDLIHAVRNSLRNEVGLFKQISGTKLQVLKNYIHVLAEFFPADRREFMLFLMKLSAWILPFEQMDDTTYMDKLTELDVELHPWDINVNTWGNCKGSVPGRRGYPCSLWTLFHTLTVVAHEKNQQFPVLDTIHSYVKEFFGCKDCSTHFTKMVADDGALMMEKSSDQIIWLWKAHNKVNLRLKGSLSEDPAYPKIIYPSQTQCPQCYGENDELNEPKVLDFLMTVYSKPERTLQPSKSAPERISSAYHDRRKSPGIFNGPDYWLFVIVYFSVAVLLVLGYLHFRSRGRFDISSIFCRRLAKSAMGKNNV